MKLTGQALELLSLLLERPGEVIAREEIERRLWPDTNVEVNHSLDVVVSRVRTALGDKGAGPRYIETVPRKGYRFSEPVSVSPEAARPANQRRSWTRALLLYAAIAILAAIVALLFVRTRYDKFVPSQRPQQAPPTVPAR